MKPLLVSLLVSFLITILNTVPFARCLALYLNIFDVPDLYLKKHTQVTPYLGGAAIFISFWITNFLFNPCNEIMFGLLIGSILIFIAGLIDDIFVLRPFQKIQFQFLAAFSLIFFGFYLNLNWPFYLDRLLSMVWMLTLMNAFNLVDVMDGLATIISISVASGLAFYAFYLKQDLLGNLLIILLGALFGFFYYNRPRAKIYLGDAGSMLIGAILAAISLKINWNSIAPSFFLGYFIPPIIFGIPLLEVSSLILIRKFKKIPFYNGSPDHYIHYLKAKEWSEWAILLYTLFYGLLINAFSLAVAFLKIKLSLLLSLGLLLQLLWAYVVFSKKS